MRAMAVDTATFYTPFFVRNAVRNLLLLLLLLSQGCALTPPAPGIGVAVAWSRVPAWDDDAHAQAWPALLQTCASRVGTQPDWVAICRAAQTQAAPSDAVAKQFFETWFVPHRVYGAEGADEGLITGYYEPLLFGKRQRDARFRYPLYQPPRDLLTIDLTAIYPELRGKPLRGRLRDGRVVPYLSRAEIETQNDALTGHELLWVDDPLALFFLQIQGSGRVRLPDDTTVAVGYADQNGHPYVPVGKCLIDKGLIPAAEVNLVSIRAWLRANPTRANEMLNCNPSYIFFRERDLSPEQGPIGALGVSLTTLRSIAVDANIIPLGSPVWLTTTLPANGASLRQLVFAQDTGGAIRGPVRADLFCGRGMEAEELAGAMKQRGSLWVLLPRAQIARR